MLVHRACAQLDRVARGVVTTGRTSRLLALAVAVALMSTAMVGGLSSVDRAEASSISASDSFERSTPRGWGTASSGSAWMASAGASTFSVDGHRGLSLLTAGTFSRAALGTPILGDADVVTSLSIDKLPGGSGFYAGVFVRLTTAGEYRGTVRIKGNGTVTGTISRLGSSSAAIGTEKVIAGLTAAPGMALRARLVATGAAPTRLRLAVWRAGQAEPAAQVSASDSAPTLQGPGSVGITSSLSSSALTPVTVAYDDVVLSGAPATATSPIPTATPTTQPAPTPTATPAPTVTTACTGTKVVAGSDLASVVNSTPAGRTVCIGAGRYRLSTALAPRANVTLSGAGAILDGSVSLTSWTKASTGWYSAGHLPAAYAKTGTCENDVTRPCQIAEQVFQDDVRLTRVTSLSALAARTFYEDFAANRVYVGSDPFGHALSMSKTRTAISSSASGVTVKGLTVEKFASLAQRGAVLANGPSWRLQGNTVRNNHAVGIVVSTSNGSVVSGNVITANGQLGLAVNASSAVLVDANTITSNNRDGFWISDWESGGLKATKASARVTNNTISSNTGVGLWFDVDSKGVTIDGNTVRSNVADGIRVEISYNVVVSNNTVTGNGISFGSVRAGGTSIYACAGININTVSTISIYGNTVSGNINGIGLQARNRGAGPYGVRTLANAEVHDNKITMMSGSVYGQGATGLVQSAGSALYFTSRGNRFYSNSYVLDSATARRFAWKDTYFTMAQWKAAGNDAGGTVVLG